MGDKTGIEWTDATWNPVVGCSRVSTGCDNCYAIGQAARLVAMAESQGQDTPYAGTVADGDWTGVVRTVPDRLDQPLRWKRPRRIFVNSMSDLFHPDVPAGFIADVFSVMRDTPQHTYQILTKRPQRMRSLVSASYAGWDEVLPNVWLGTSIETDQYTFRADHLRQTPARVRFLSLEPLLGPLPSLDLEDIGWVIVGGESGSRARTMHPDWVRDIRDRCVDAGVPFFFKQWGEWAPATDPYEMGAVTVWPGQLLPDSRPCRMVRVGKLAAGRELDGRTWDEYPEGI